jgi:hypothetical protein
VHPLLTANVRLVGTLGGLGVPGMLSHGCLSGACCADSRRLLGAQLPEGVGFVSVYSRSDGVIDWRAALDPAAEHVEVESTHVGMPLNAAVFRVVAERLPVIGRDAVAAPMRAAA